MPEQLEERLTLLEAEVDRLKRKIEPNLAKSSRFTLVGKNSWNLR
jgi:uncharacterized small protein (DUF1192 family)